MTVSALKSRILIALCAALTTTTVAGAGQAISVQPLAALEAAAEAALRERLAGARAVQIEVTPVDERLRLALCDAPLQASIAGSGPVLGRQSVEVACAGTAGWRVRVTATASESAEVWTLARPVRRGESLSRDVVRREQIRLGTRDARALRVGRSGDEIVRVDPDDPDASLEPLLGRVFSRGAGAGRLLDRRALDAPVLVERGRQVRMSYRARGVSIDAVGTALADGRLGERIRVKNDVTGVAVDATVASSNEVTIR